MGLTDFLKGQPNEIKMLHSEWASLRAVADDRIVRMQTYRDENQVVRDPNLALATNDTTDYGRTSKTQEPQRHNITLPLGNALTIKHAYRIAGQLPDVIVDQRDESPQERYRSDMMEKIVWAILQQSDGETQIADAAWDGSQLGSSCFDMYFDIEKQMPILRAVDPTGIVEVQGVDDPHNFERVYRSWAVPTASIRAQYMGKSFRGEAIDVNEIKGDHMEGQTEMTTIIQLCDSTRLLRFTENCVGLYERVHNYGFTPYIVIPNIGPYRDVWGWADYEMVRPLVSYLTALVSREADVLRQVANGSYIDRGTGQLAEETVRTLRVGGVIPSKKDGALDPIQAADMPSFEQEHANRVMELFKMVGFAPDAAWGKPGSSSGTDRGMQLQPLLELTAMKQKNWQRGLSRAFAMGYKMIEGQMTLTKTYRGAAHGQAGRRMPFVFQMGPNVEPASAVNPDFQPDSLDSIDVPEFVDLPRSPKELFDGDYAVRFMWQNRLDPDDPSFILSEINRFQSGLQSLETTLERLGFQAPEDEMRRIENEADRFPWINDGRVALLMAQMRGNAQGTGGGAPTDTSGALDGAMETMSDMGPSGGVDAGTQAAGATGQLYGGA